MQIIAILRQHKEHDTQHIQLDLVSTHNIIIDSVLTLFIYSYKYLYICFHTTILLWKIYWYTYKYGKE